MTIEYRQINQDEFRALAGMIERGFGSHYEPSDERYEIDEKVFTPEMTMVAFDDGTIVGSTAALPF